MAQHTFVHFRVCQRRCCALRELLLLREGSVQAVWGELSTHGLAPAGKCSFATGRVILAAFATQGRLSAQEMQRSQCWGWERAFEGWEEIRGWGDGCGHFRWGSIRAEAAPSQAVERCGAARALSSLVVPFSNRRTAVTLLLGATLTAQPSVHNDKRLPVLQVNVFSSYVRRQP